jgi:hypothetical protein
VNHTGKPKAESRKLKAVLESVTVGGVEYAVTAGEARVLAELRIRFDMEREGRDLGGWFQAIELFPGKLMRAQMQRQTLRRLASRRLVKQQRAGGIERFAPVIHDVDERTCRRCACTESTACHHDDFGPCFWIEPDLCSHCEPNPRRAS